MQMTRVTQRVRQRSLVPDTDSGDGHGADFGGVVDTYEEEIFRYLGRLTGDSASSLSTLRRHAEECQSCRDGWDASKPFSRRLMRALRSQMMCRPNR